MKNLPVAVQMYSVREEAERDFKGVIKKIKDMGYNGVELAGTYGIAPEDVRDIIKNAGLEPVSAHVPYEELISDMGAAVDKYKLIGCSYIAVPYLTEEYRPGNGRFSEVIENIEKLGVICAKKGIVLLYHNHDFEFVKMDDGRYALDYLFDTVKPELLQTEIDTCWVKVSEVDPAEYLIKYQNRSPLVHLKDFTGGKTDNMYEQFQFRALGYGNQDLPAILEASLKAGAKWVVVEQDEHYENSAMEDIKLSREHLNKLGW